MTQRQINWARQHDWFRGAKGNSVIVEDVEYNHETKQVEATTVSFNDFNDLYYWAGY